MEHASKLSGLSAQEAAQRLDVHGPNEMPRLPPVPWWRTAARQVASPLILILVLAAGLAALLGETIDAAVIVAVVVLNAALGFVQEWRAERALAALTDMLDPSAIVRRDGQEHRIPARDIVPGDILILTAGDRIAADGSLLISRQAEIDESVLTGESVPVSKSPGQGISAGTSMVLGSAEVEVTATGPDTAFAEIAQLTGGIDRRPTRLQIVLGRLARWLGIVAILIGAGVALLGVLAGQDMFAMVLTAISLAVAMVPEGLPAVVTITLALGAGAMARKNALVRRMQAIETLGAATVICTDKTGTLTENRMVATHLWAAGGLHDIPALGAADGAGLYARIATVAGICTHATRSIDASGIEHSVGSPTEVALLELALRIGDVPAGDALAEVPFSSERKRMSMLFDGPGGRRLLLKGAPEVVLQRASHVAWQDADVAMTNARRKDLTQAYEALAAQGLRVIALADRGAVGEDIEEDDLCLLGFVGLMDPPRMEVAGAIGRARDAGIRVIMITGDSPVTARTISQDLGIPVQQVLTGDALGTLTDVQLTEALRSDVLFARTRPADKLRIVQALQANGAVVAMTGDGVNDAPALKRADIGVAMGQRGTDVAQEAADVILLDDNFRTIVNAIDEGRRQFLNIRKFVRYLLSSNAGEVVALVANILIGGPLIFLATQILWMNLVTDGVTAVALGLEKAEPGQMHQPPRDPDSPILGRSGVLLILAFGTYTGCASLFLFYTFLPVDPAVANTLAFTAMVVFEKMSVFAFRSLKTPVSRIGWLSNRFLILALIVTLGLQVAAVYLPGLQILLHTVPLQGEHWLWIAGLSLPLLIVPEAIKWARARHSPQQPVVIKEG
ncbi:cation-translocating P-type ATPase [Tateyamaria sp. SN3-11]|uniref:cation-translocating P-type ATPase n=1 Tax=Tateyamaria sp. SN3-11 TaxID=3092147 RepID=UPI0039EB9263